MDIVQFLWDYYDQLVLDPIIAVGEYVGVGVDTEADKCC